MTAALLALALPLAADAAEEGRKVVLAMLATGCVFLAVIALGELTDWALERRRARRAARRPVY